MGKFLDLEKDNAAIFKSTSSSISESARKDGIYRGKPRPFCLPESYSIENLFPEIRQTAPTYFASHNIKWHDAIDNKPSNHLCDSMVCGVNFLFPFTNQPAALTELLRPLYPQIKQVLPVEDGQYIAFEWIGAENYLGERMPRYGTRTRGANFTSADAAVMFEIQDGRKQFVLIEWKYTESYSPTSYKISKSGTDRTAIYSHLYLRDDFPLNKELLPGFDSLFYEPFYQFMRQQCLANEMEIAHESGADIVSLLHISPAANQDFQRVTSSALTPLGDTVTAIWNKLQTRPSRFKSTHVETMFNTSTLRALPDLNSWREYIKTRYRWVAD